MVCAPLRMGRTLAPVIPRSASYEGSPSSAARQPPTLAPRGPATRPLPQAAHPVYIRYRRAGPSRRDGVVLRPHRSKPGAQVRLHHLPLRLLPDFSRPTDRLARLCEIGLVTAHAITRPEAVSRAALEVSPRIALTSRRSTKGCLCDGDGTCGYQLYVGQDWTGGVHSVSESTVFSEHPRKENKRC